REVGIRAVDLLGEAGLERRRREVGRNAVVLGLREVLSKSEEVLELLLDLAAELVLAKLVDEDLHPLLVDVVAPRVAVPHAQDRLQIRENLPGRQEVADLVGDERRAAHATAGVAFE